MELFRIATIDILLVLIIVYGIINEERLIVWEDKQWHKIQHKIQTTIKKIKKRCYNKWH